MYNTMTKQGNTLQHVYELDTRWERGITMV